MSGETDPKFHEEIKKRSIPVTGKKDQFLFSILCVYIIQTLIILMI